MKKFEFESISDWSAFIDMYWPVFTEDTEWHNDEFETTFWVSGKIRGIWNHKEQYGIVRM